VSNGPVDDHRAVVLRRPLLPLFAPAGARPLPV